MDGTLSDFNLSEKKTPDRKLKFTDFYFSENYKANILNGLVYERKKYFSDLKKNLKIHDNLCVFASPAQGKTVSTKLYFDKLKAKNPHHQIIYIDCAEHSTEKKVFKEFVNQAKTYYPPIESYAEDNERTAVKKYAASLAEGVVCYLILDEIDIPILSSKQHSDIRAGWLNVFFRAQSPTDEPKPSQFKTVLITNKWAFESKLHENERQHLIHIGMDRYFAQDIAKILQKRVIKGIDDSKISPNIITDEMLTRMGVIIENQHESNIRVALELIKKTAERAIKHNKTVTETDINNAAAQIDILIGYQDITRLSKHSMIFIFSALLFLDHKNKTSSIVYAKGYPKNPHDTFTLKEIVPYYETFCSKNNIKKGKSTLRNFQNYSQTGLVTGILDQTGETRKKFRVLQFTRDPVEVFEIIKKNQVGFDFDIKLGR